MSKFRLRKEFLDIGEGMMHSVFPQITEVKALTSKLGYTSDNPTDQTATLEDVLASIGYYTLSGIGAVIGSPLGLLPVLMDAYSAGIGTKVKRETTRSFRTYRFTPDMVIALARRKFGQKEGGKDFWEDLDDLGFDEERMAGAKELVEQIPPLSDMVRFADFHAFDPEVIERWRKFYECPEDERNALELVGIFGDWANKYWFSHWRQPGRFEIGELHRRDLINDDDARMAYRTMGYSEFWQDALLELVKAVPTRVDVRRWWDMGTVNEEELREIYHKQGYYGDDLDKYVLWTKVYVAFPDLIARYKNGWITEDMVRAELIALGMPEERAETMLQTKFKKPVAEERVAETTKLTRALIIKGAKEQRLTKEQTIDLLIRKNYEVWEAEYIYEIEVEAAASPETPLEFRQLVESYRKSQGLDYVVIPPELLEVEKTLWGVETRLKEARATSAAQEDIDQLQAEAAILKTKFDDMAALHPLTTT